MFSMQSAQTIEPIAAPESAHIFPLILTTFCLSKNVTNDTLAFDDDRQTGAHKDMERAYHKIKYVKMDMSS